MTSPVDTSVKFFHSGMPGAPVLQTVTGSLIALLDACLVNGFGALTLTSLVVSGGVATAAFAGTFPALPESVVQIGGATGPWSDLNGEQKVTALGSGTFQFATALPSGTATGAITAKMAPAGWGIPFTGTNLRAYRSNDLTGTARHFLRVSDVMNPAVTMSARVVGYETMTAISTGTGLFPTNAQQNGGLNWAHGYPGAAETTPLNWTIIANHRRFYIYIAYGMSTNFGGPTYDAELGAMFGEFPSLKSTVDNYNSVLMGGTSGGGHRAGPSMVNFEPNDPSLVIARGHTNAAGAQYASYNTGIRASGYASGRAGQNFGPLNGVMGRMMLQQPMLAIDMANNGPRGILPEVFLIPQEVPSSIAGLSKGDITLGSGVAAGKRLLAVPGSETPAMAAGASRYVTLFDVTGPWA